MTDHSKQTPRRTQNTPAVRPRSKIVLAQTAFLLTSRRRQREVFGPAAIAAIIGLALFLDTLTGTAIPIGFARLMALLFGAWAGYAAWQHSRRVLRWTALDVALVIAGGLLVIGALAFLASGGVRQAWAVLLTVFAVSYIVQTAAIS